MVILVYVDDCIILSKSKMEVDKFITSMKEVTEKQLLTGEGIVIK